MNRITKNLIWITLFFLITLNVISAQSTIDQEVLDKLDSNEGVSVTVTLKDTSNLNYANAKTLVDKSKIYAKDNLALIMELLARIYK